MERPRSTRDIVFCHECENEWFRDEHGLTCNDCHSEFTEIIESDHDPRVERLTQPSEDDGMDYNPQLQFMGPGPPQLGREPRQDYTAAHPQLHPLHDHNPWEDAPDPDEDDISGVRWTSSGPGSFRFETTFTRGGTRNSMGVNSGAQSPQGGLGHNFTSMLEGILGIRNFPPLGAQAQPRAGGDAPVRIVQGGGPGHRFTYTTSTRILPRDANNPQPRIQPLDDLHPMLAQIFGPQGVGSLPGERENTQAPGADQPFPPNPIFGLLSSLLGTGGTGSGDYVFNQEQLDRVISQLMEQNASGSAPGPASQDAIRSLPKKPITPDMLGPEGRAECSICMDEVNIGQEVTFLPCNHWFHDQCVGAWLGEHDTCPHCRKSISDSSKRPQTAQTTPHGGPSTQTDPAESFSPASRFHPSTPPGRMPGAFDNGSPSGLIFGSSSSSTGDNLAQMESEPAGQQPSNTQQLSHDHAQSASSRRSSTSDNSGGGIGSRIRRSFFGTGSNNGR